MITAKQLKQRYLDFFKSKEHAIVESASLIPENDPSALFISAGMHPLVPFLLGEKHPFGKRLANCQKCLRLDDINEVGDNRHLTFFLMLGNWSLGDYFKKEAIEWSFEFLTKILKISPDRIYISIFEGDKDAPRDKETIKCWQSVFKTRKINAEFGDKKKGVRSNSRIFLYPKAKNWWGPVGKTGPCGPCTEMFFDTGKPHNKKYGKVCHPNCECGRFIEIWNDVFMEYNRTKEGKYGQLKQKNVDTGMGLERTAMVLQEKETVFDTELFSDIIAIIKKPAKKEDARAFRIIADHLRAAVFILADEKKVVPSNVEQGYVLRRLIRRAIRFLKQIGIEQAYCADVAEAVILTYCTEYPELAKNRQFIIEELKKEEERFTKVINIGLRRFEQIFKMKGKVTAEDAFFLYQSFGFPLETTKELVLEKGLKLDERKFEKEFAHHQEISRTASEKKFRGGLADAQADTTKLHTATHLLHAALRQVLGNSVRQSGSNITSERMRFDFTFDRALTSKEIKKAEDIVNQKIREAVPIVREEMNLEEAKKHGALAFFKYGEKVSVYTIGNFSKEVCMGPHVKNTKELGSFKILKEEGVATGVRRIKAVLE